MTEARRFYTGSCHCGQGKYSFSLSPPIESQEVTQCNCSICSTNGYLFVYPGADDFHVDCNEDNLKQYRFASEQVPHYFCGNCGSSLFCRSFMEATNGVIAVNVRTVQGIDVDRLKLKKMDGKSYSLK
ncbi:Mss4-like protein [Aspergillus avenaceus]|uniref:Mss4-like protein n=1 Tax=Aspergillus avenaceus TaxID=36643 RepID=A0A5N6U8U1_ASPAV|nr:Mss4-like protein [Aspergillus avenaceus]